MTRRALVTGAAGGVGGATAAWLAGHGWHVLGVDVSDVGDGRAEGVDYIRADASDPSQLERVKAWVEGFGNLDGVVNNAAIQLPGGVTDTAQGAWEQVMDVNAGMPFRIIQAFADSLVATKGSIVNVCSVHAVATSVGSIAYAASKGALLALTRAVAVELGPDGVRCNAVLPGAVDTKMLRDGLAFRGNEAEAEQSLTSLRARTPLRRIGNPSDIAGLIGFLLDGEVAGYVTGQGFVADGGALAALSTE